MENSTDPLIRQIKGECDALIHSEYDGRAVPWLVEQQVDQIKKACDFVSGCYDALRTSIEVCKEKGEGHEAR